MGAREAGENVGRTVELSVTKIAHGGIAVARLDGRVVFVSDAIPGERVLARIADDSKKAFWRADTVSVLDASEHRRPHIWPEAALERDPADRAGGAEFGHIRLAHQRELKRDVLVEAMQRMGGVDVEVDVEPLPGDDEAEGTGWRTRVRLQVDDDGRIGPYAARSHRVIGVESLPLATDAVQAAAPLGERFAGEPFVEVVAPAGEDARLVIGAQKPTPIIERVGDREFRLDDTGFWQVHRHAAATLSAAVRDAIDPALVDPRALNLDLYGGVGLLAAAFLDEVGGDARITTVESDERATEHAADNLADHVGARAVTGRVERWLAELARSAEPARLRAATVVLDPPRSGAGRGVVDSLAAMAPAQLVYVACDPVALARDTGLLRERGFELTRLRAFDLFPNTHHLEAVATFTRVRRSPE